VIFPIGNQGTASRDDVFGTTGKTGKIMGFDGSDNYSQVSLNDTFMYFNIGSVCGFTEVFKIISNP